MGSTLTAFTPAACLAGALNPITKTKMETITRNIVRVRGTSEVLYRFTTYPIIFQKAEGALGALCGHLRAAFVGGLPGGTEDSPSQARELLLKHEAVRHHLLTKYAAAANYEGKGSGQHWAVQQYLLANDPHTLAVEVPVWGQGKEGCMDIVQWLPEGKGRIVIADFKPEVHKCAGQAMTQLFWYRAMLAECTGIALANFECLAFDNRHCYRLLG